MPKAGAKKTRRINCGGVPWDTTPRSRNRIERGVREPQGKGASVSAPCGTCGHAEESHGISGCWPEDEPTGGEVCRCLLYVPRKAVRLDEPEDEDIRF